MRNNYRGIDAATASFEAVTVLSRPALFTYGYVDPATVPRGMFQYAVKHHSENTELPIQICQRASVNRYGTLLSSQKIALFRRFDSPVYTRELDPEEDWLQEGFASTLSQYLEQYPICKARIPTYER